MDNETKELLNEINNSLKDFDETLVNIEFNTEVTATSQFKDKNSISNSGISNSDINLQMLSVIFGFLVGYFLIKSFFDGYKI